MDRFDNFANYIIIKNNNMPNFCITSSSSPYIFRKLSLENIFGLSYPQHTALINYIANIIINEINSDNPDLLLNKIYDIITTLSEDSDSKWILPFIMNNTSNFSESRKFKGIEKSISSNTDNRDGLIIQQKISLLEKSKEGFHTINEILNSVHNYIQAEDLLNSDNLKKLTDNINKIKNSFNTLIRAINKHIEDLNTVHFPEESLSTDVNTSDNFTELTIIDESEIVNENGFEEEEITTDVTIEYDDDMDNERQTFELAAVPEGKTNFLKQLVPEMKLLLSSIPMYEYKNSEWVPVYQSIVLGGGSIINVPIYYTYKDVYTYLITSIKSNFMYDDNHDFSFDEFLKQLEELLKQEQNNVVPNGIIVGLTGYYYNIHTATITQVNRADNTVLAGASSFKQKLGLTYNNGKFEINKDNAMYSETFHKLLTVAFSRNAESFYTILDNGVFKQNSQNINDGKSILRNAFLSSKFMIRDPKTNKFYYRKDIIERDIINFIKNQILSKINSPNVRSIDFNQNEVVDILTKLLPLFNFDNDFIRFITTDAITTQYRTGVKVSVKIKVNEETNKKANDNKSLSINDLSEIKFLSNNNLLSVIFNTFNNILDDEVSENLVEFNPLDANYNFLESIPMRVITKGMMKLLSFNISPAFLSSSGKQFYSFVNKNKFSSAFAKILATNIKKWDSRKTAKLKGNLERMIADNPEMKNNLLLSKLISILKKRDNSPALVMAALDYGVLQSTVFNKMAKEFDSATDYLRLLSYFVLWQNTYDITGEGEKVLETITYYPLATTANNPIKRVVKLFKYINTLVSKKDDTVMRNSLKNYGKYKGDITLLEGPVNELSRILKFLSLQNNESLSSAERLKLKTLSQFIVYPFLNKNVTIDTLSEGSFRVTIIKDNVPHDFITDGDFTNDGNIKNMLYSLYYEYIDKLTNENLRYVSDKLITDEDPFIALSKKQIINEMILGYIPTQTHDALDSSVTNKLNSILNSTNSFYSKSKGYSGKPSLQYLLNQLLKYQAGNTDDKAIYIPKSVNGKIVTFYTKEELYNEKGKALSEEEIYNALFIINELYEKKINSELSVEIANDNPSESNIQILTKLLKYNFMLTLENNTNDKTVEKASYNVELFNKREYAEVLMYRLLFDMTLNTHLNNVAVSEIMGGDASNFVVSDSKGEILELDTIYNTFKRNTSYRALIIPHDALTKSEIQIERDALGNLTSLSKGVNEKRIFYNGYISDIIEPSNELFKHIMMRESLDVIFDNDIYDILFSQEMSTSDKNKKVLEDMSNLRKQYLRNKSKVSHDQVFNLFGKLSAKYQDMINEELLEKVTDKKSVIYKKLEDKTYFKIKKTDAADQCTFLFFLRRAKSYGYISTQLADELITAISARIDAARNILITSDGNPNADQLAQIDMMLDYSDLITPENIKKLKDDFIKELRQRKVQIPSDLSFDDIVVLTMKDVYVGEYRNENLDIRELIFDKNATRVLTPSSLQNDKLDMLRKMMELLEIDRVSPPSAIKTKVASISYPSSDKSFWNQNFTSIADAIRWSKDNMTVLELNSDDYGEQTPQSASNKALFSAQAKSLIFSSQRHDQEYKFAVLNGNVLRTSPLDRKTASDTFVSFQQLWDKVYSIEREKFLKKVTNADNKIDASKFIAYLKSNLIHSKAISQNDLDGLITLDQLVKMYNNSDLSSSIKKILGEIKSNAELSSKLDNILSDKELKEEDLYKFAIPIMFMPNSFKIQSIMNSMITTRIVDKGLKGVLVPDLQIPFESLTRFQKKNWVNKITLTNPKRWNGMTSLKDMRYENGKIQPAQVVVSWNFKGKSKHMVEFDPTSGTFTEQKQNEDFLSNIEYVTVKVDKKTKNITIHKSNKSNLDDDSLKVIYNKVTQYIKSQGVNVKNIRIYVDDGKYYFEYTSSENSILDINDFLLKEGDEGYQKGKKIIDIRKIPKNILRGFGVRIPTQEKASMVFFEIVGFITGVEQSVMIAPSDFLVRMGSDFDIDTLYSLLYNYIYDQKEQKFIINKYIPESISKHLLRKYYKKYIDKNKEKITRIIDAKVKLLKSNIARLEEKNNITFDEAMKDFKKELNRLIPTDDISKHDFNKIVFDDIFGLSNIFNEINEIIQNSLLNNGNDNYDEYLNRINSVISLFQTLLNSSIKKVSSSPSVGQLIPTMKSESSLEKYIKEMMTKLRYYEYVKSKYHDVQSRNINISDMKKTAINRLNSQIKTNLDDIQLTFEGTPKFTKDTNTYANKKSISGISLRYDNIIEIIGDIIEEKESQENLEEKDKNDIIFLKQLLEKLQDINSNSVSKLVNFLKIIDSASTNDKKSTQLLKVELIATYNELKEALKQLPTQEEFDKLKTLVKNSTVSNNMLIDSFIDDHIKYISTNNKSSLLYKSKKIIKDVIKLHNLNNTKGSNISSKFKLALALTKDSSNMMLYDDFRKKSVIEQNNYNAILNHLKDHYITVMVQPENLKSITLALDYGDVYRDTDTQEIPNDVFETFIKNFTTENNADKRIQLINDLINNYSLASIMDQFNEKLITPDINSWMYNELIYNQMRSSGVLIGAMALNQSFQELLRISGIDVGFNPELSFVKSLIPDISNDPNIKFKVTDSSSVMTGNRFIDETIVEDPINESKGTIDKYREGSLYISLGVDDSKIQAINRINLTILNINPTIGFLSKGFGAHWVMLTINQPIVKQFGELYEKNINNGDKRTDAVKNAYLELMNTYTEMVRELGVSEDSIPQLIADTVPSLDKLMFDLIYNAKSLSTDTNPITKQNYYIHQLAVLRNYMIAYDIGNLFSEIYRKSNTDSKGTPPTYLQTIYKLDDFETIFNNHPLTNIENVFGKVYYLKYIPSLKTMYLEDDILKFERLYEIIQKASPSNLDIDTYSNISINYKGQVYQRGRSTNKDILKQIISDITNTYVNNINLLLSNNNYSMYEKLYILREIYIRNNKQDAIQFITTLLDEFTDKPFIESNINFVQSLVNKLSIGDNEKIFLSEYYLLLSKNNEILRLNNVIVIPSNFKTFAIRDGLSFPRRMFSSYFKYDSELFNKIMNNYYALSGGRIYMGSEKNVKFIESHLLSWLMNSYFKGIDKFQLKETLTQQFILFSKYIDDTLSNNISDDVKFKLSNYKSLLSTLRLDMENGLIMFNPDSINNNAIMFQIFSMMLNDDSKISDTLYEIKDFAHNLLVYWITINGGHFSLRSISSFLPNLIYAQTNFMKYLRNINWDNPFEFEEIDSFAIQLMQSNPKFMIPFENIEKINRLKGKVDSYSYVKNYKTNVYGFIYKKDSSQNPIKGMTAKGTNKIYMSLSLLHSFSTLAYNKATKGESIDINNFTDRLIEMLKNNEIREELQSIFDISEDIINKAVNFLEKAKANPDNSYLQLDNLDYSFQGHKIVEMSHNRFSKIGFSENNENKSIFGFLLKKLEQDMVDSVETNTPLVRINIDIPDSISDTYSAQTTNLIYIDKTNDINESLFLKSFEKNKFIMYKGAEFETIADMIAYEILMSGTNNDNTIISFIKNIYRNKIGKIDLYPNKEEKEKRYVDIRDIIASLMSGNFDGKLENNYSLYKFEEGKGYKRTKDKMTVNDILKLLINNFNNPELTIEKFKEYFKSDAIVNDEIVVKRLQNNYKTLFSTIEEGSSSFKNLVKALVENPLSTTYHYVVNAIYPRFGKHYSENTTPFINIYGNILREYIKFVKSSRNVFTISSEDYNKFRETGTVYITINEVDAALLRRNTPVTLVSQYPIVSMNTAINNKQVTNNTDGLILTTNTRLKGNNVLHVDIDVLKDDEKETYGLEEINNKLKNIDSRYLSNDTSVIQRWISDGKKAIEHLSSHPNPHNDLEIQKRTAILNLLQQKLNLILDPNSDKVLVVNKDSLDDGVTIQIADFDYIALDTDRDLSESFDVPYVEGDVKQVDIVENIYSKLGNQTQSENVVIKPKGEDIFDYWKQFKKENPNGAILAYRGKPKFEKSPFFVIGNPIDWQDLEKQLGRKRAGIETTKQFIGGVLNSNEPEFVRIRDLMKSGVLKGKPILYYEEKGYATHATALDYLINKYNWNTEIQDKQNVDNILSWNPKWKPDAIKYLPNGNILITGYRTDKVEGMTGVAQRGKGLYISLDTPLEGEGYSIMQFEINPNEMAQTSYSNKSWLELLDESDEELEKHGYTRKQVEDYINSHSFGNFINGARHAADIDRSDITFSGLSQHYLNNGVRALIGLLEPGFPMFGREIVIYDQDIIDSMMKTKTVLSQDEFEKELNDYKNRNLSKPIETVQSTNNLSDYTNHSGGALKKEKEGDRKLTPKERRISADLVWEDIGDREFGVETKSYTFKGHDNGSKEDFKVYTNNPEYEQILKRANVEYEKAAAALGREITKDDYIKKLMLRNWFQAYYADKIFAIGKINKKSKVDGGTGYAVQMAINNSKPVVVFDLNDNQWKEWDYNLNIWQSIDTPILTKNFAGIGTREITQAGVNAIREVYQKTLNSSEADKPKVLMTPEQYKDWILKSDDTRAKWIREQIKNKQYSGLHIATNRDKTKHASILYSLLNSDQEDIDKIKQDKEDRKNKLIKSIQGIDFTKYKKLIFDAGVLSKFILPLLPKNTITSMGYVITQNKSKERNKVTITISKNSITDDIDITDIITTLNKDKDIQQIIRLDSKYLLDTNQFTSDEIKTIKRTQYDKLNEDIKHKLDLLLLSYIKKALKNLENPFSSENAIKLSNIDVSLISKTDIFKESPMIKDIGTLLRYIKAALFTDSTDIIYDVHQLSLMNANDIFDSINSRIHNKKIVKLFLRQSEYEYVKNTISKKNINLVIKDGSKPYLISLSSAIKISDLESKLVTQKNPVNFTKIRSLTDLRDGNIVGFIITPDFVNGLDIDDTNISIIEDLISNINYGKVKMSRQVFYTFIKKYIKYTSFVSFNRIDDIITNGYLIDITSVTPENSTIIDKNNERLNKMFEELKCINNPNDML